MNEKELYQYAKNNLWNKEGRLDPLEISINALELFMEKPHIVDKHQEESVPTNDQIRLGDALSTYEDMACFVSTDNETATIYKTKVNQ